MKANAGKSIRGRLALAAIATALYWYWESKASGNIRIDLIVIYPLLAVLYAFALWPRFRFHALYLSGLIMIFNVMFLIISYDLFSKNPG